MFKMDRAVTNIAGFLALVDELAFNERVRTAARQSAVERREKGDEEGARRAEAEAVEAEQFSDMLGSRIAARYLLVTEKGEYYTTEQLALVGEILTKVARR